MRTLAKVAFSTVDRLRGHFPGPRILIYHQIGAGHGRQMDVSREDFAAQLDWIQAADFDVVSLEAAIKRRSAPDAHRLVVLTFDDGYQDMFLAGYPQLRDRRLPFTLYVTSAPIETRRPLATDRLATPLTWDQIDEMAASGLATLGAHTHTHPDLRQIGRSVIEDDLARCDELLEQRTGIRPRHFAYPWGYWSSEGDEVVRARYDSAVLGGGPPIRPDTDVMLLNRIPVQLSDGVGFFAAKLHRGQRTEESVRRRISGYRGP